MLKTSEHPTSTYYYFSFSHLSLFLGSISAEHGVGQLKRDYLYISKSPEEREVMCTLKKSLDPRNTMNPGKVLGEDSLGSLREYEDGMI